MDRRKIKSWILLLLLTPAECHRMTDIMPHDTDVAASKTDSFLNEDDTTDEGDAFDSVESGTFLNEDGISEYFTRQVLLMARLSP